MLWMDLVQYENLWLLAELKKIKNKKPKQSDKDFTVSLSGVNQVTISHSHLKPLNSESILVHVIQSWIGKFPLTGWNFIYTPIYAWVKCKECQ